jgi:hypothetical protein
MIAVVASRTRRRRSPGILRFGRRQVFPENLVDDVVEEAFVIGLVAAVLHTRHREVNPSRDAACDV